MRQIRALACGLTAVVVLIAAASAQAVVVDVNALGQPSVVYNGANQSGYYGVALVPGTRVTLAAASVPPVLSSAPCIDPALSSDLVLPDTGVCSHGGPVMHSNETFALTWDPLRRYWQTTRSYLEQFLSDVAVGSGTFSSPYAVTTQYTDATGRALNSSLYGGACIDYGAVGGSACKFANTTGTGPGHDYPASACPVTGTNQFDEDPSGVIFTSSPNDVCVTASQIETELTAMVAQTGMIGRTKHGYTPLVVLLMPPGVVTCLDGAGALCSVNSAAVAQFCSYHGQVNVGGTDVAYVVQPFSALTACDEPDAPQLKQSMTAQQVAAAIGGHIVSPLSQAHIATIVNPALNGWFALDGSEINDNGCVPLPDKLDSAGVGKSSQNPYFLQREFNNAGVIETDPNALRCVPGVDLSPVFVSPSAVNQGDEVQFDGSTTISTLIVPRADYLWSFGDGTTAVGPSVVHVYSHGGTYTVKLAVVDRGGNLAGTSQTITVVGPGGPPPPPPGGGGGGGPKTTVKLQLMPQSLRSVLSAGLAMRVTSNARADGIVTVSISRSAARRAHIALGRGPAVVIGRGTVSGIIKSGTVRLRLRLSRGVAGKLARLGHLTLSVRLALVSAGGRRVAVVVAGRY